MRKKRTQTTSVSADYIIPRTHHTVSKTDINVNALKVLNRLSGAGFEAYLVGGSVRDLLLGKAPKDFDVATSATPNDIRKLFKNCRIIGRRFKLAHILFHREIIEVATFRKGYEQEEAHLNDKGMIVRDNEFGTLSEDAWRRDFTLNSLYYNVEDASIIDHTGGVKDIQSRIIRMIGDPVKRYQEDPVRMLRALRFSAKLGFTIEPSASQAIHQYHHLLADVSNSRLFDEIAKIYQSGASKVAHQHMLDYGFFQILFPQAHALLTSNPNTISLIQIALESTDARVHEGKPITPAFLFAVFLWFPLRERQQFLEQSHNLPPLVALEQAMNHVLQKQIDIINVPKRHTQVVREIWLLQFRFARRHGVRAYQLLEHSRFRAAYDFMVMRALAHDEDMELADWWTHFQDVSPDEREHMIKSLPSTTPRKRGKRTRKTAS